MGTDEQLEPGTLRVESRSERRTIALGRSLAAALAPGDLVLLDGPMGAGKTRFVRGLAGGLGAASDAVSSPTYALAHEYRDAEGRPALRHIDAYRLASPDDLESIGFDVIRDDACPVVVEWAQRVRDAIDEPSDASRAVVRLLIAPTGDASRELTLAAPAAIWARPGARVIVDEWGRAPAGHSRCPISGRPVAHDAPTFPFFDERARMADLGNWMSGEYSLSRDIEPDDLDDPDVSPPGARERR